MTDKAAYGDYPLPRWCQYLLKLCHGIPVRSWLGKRLAFLLRKPVLMRQQSPVDVDVTGLKLRLYPKGNLSDKRLLTTPELLDGEERAYLAKELEHGARVLDIGANIGGFGLLLLNARPDLKLVAVEAHPGLADRLRQHIEFNTLGSRCTCLQVAASPQNQPVTLYLDEVNQGRNSLLSGSEPSSLSGSNKEPSSLSDSNQEPSIVSGVNRGSIDVEGMTLEGILERGGFEKAELLKMDIEGYEYPVLEQFVESAKAASMPDYIQLEQYQGEEQCAALKLLLSKGYEQVLQTRMNVILKRATK